MPGSLRPRAYGRNRRFGRTLEELVAGSHSNDVDRPAKVNDDEETAAEEIDDLEDETEETDDVDDEESDDDAERSDRIVKYWAALGFDPVEVALPRGGVGLTLREYRVVAEPEPEPEPEDEIDDEIDDVEDDEDVDEDIDEDATDLDDAEDTDDEEEDDDEAPAAKSKSKGARTKPAPIDDEDDEDEDEDTVEEDVEEDRSVQAGLAPGDEEAFFLATNGRLHLFRSPEALVEYVKSGAPNDLTSAEDWDELVSSLTPAMVVPDDEDRYELDLVVDNLRGGRDVWERDLLIGAGEFARDVGYGLGLAEVLTLLAPGTPLDDLDEALRAKGFFGRRKLKKVGSEQAALAWRGLIGRISSSVEWHE